MPAKKKDRSYKASREVDRTRAEQDAFLVAYGECGTVKASCDAVGITRSKIDTWQRSDAHGFKAKYAIAKEIFREALQDIALERVKVQKPNDNPVLLITLLNAHWPEKYRREGNVATNEVKEMMVEWKKWVRDSRQTSKEKQKQSEAESAHRDAMDEVERLLARKKE